MRWITVAVAIVMLVGCAGDPVDPTDLADAKSYVGKTTTAPIFLCPKPLLPIDQEGDCGETNPRLEDLSDNNKIIDDVVVNRGHIFSKVELANGEQGYIMFDFIDRAFILHASILNEENKILDAALQARKEGRISEHEFNEYMCTASIGLNSEGPGNCRRYHIETPNGGSDVTVNPTTGVIDIQPR
jgi:hypothetical protein